MLCGLAVVIRKGGDRRQPRRLAVSTDSGSVDRWIVGSELAPQVSPSAARLIAE